MKAKKTYRGPFYRCVEKELYLNNCIKVTMNRGVGVLSNLRNYKIKNRRAKNPVRVAQLNDTKHGLVLN